MSVLDNLLIFAQNCTGETLNTGCLPQTQATSGLIETVLNIVFVILGAIAVMMVVIGGIKYASSQGDPQAISKAKGTIIYAIVGLLVAIFARAIIGFVFGRVS